MRTIEKLVHEIQEANLYFFDQVQKQVNVSLTARNWIIGRDIVKYEQAADDRASYGDKVLKVLALRLKNYDKRFIGNEFKAVPAKYIRKLVRRCLTNLLRSNYKRFVRRCLMN